MSVFSGGVPQRSAGHGPPCLPPHEVTPQTGGHPPVAEAVVAIPRADSARARWRVNPEVDGRSISEIEGCLLEWGLCPLSQKRGKKRQSHSGKVTAAERKVGLRDAGGLFLSFLSSMAMLAFATIPRFRALSPSTRPALWILFRRRPIHHGSDVVALCTCLC